MEHLVLRQFDSEIALRIGQRVAETEIGNAIDEHAKLHHDVAGGNLFVQGAGLNAGADPRWQGGRVEAEFFDAVTAQHRREA